jgi:hypothetical protein
MLHLRRGNLVAAQYVRCLPDPGSRRSAATFPLFGEQRTYGGHGRDGRS